MSRPTPPRQHRDSLQERRIPVGRALGSGIALGQVFVELGLGLFFGFSLVYGGAFPVGQRAFLTRFSP